MKEEKNMNEIPEELRILQGLDSQPAQAEPSQEDEEEKARKRRAKIEAEINRLISVYKDGKIKESELNDKLEKFGLTIDKYGLTVQELSDIYKALEDGGIIIEQSAPSEVYDISDGLEAATDDSEIGRAHV